MSQEPHPDPYPSDTLGMTPEEMRRLAHKVADLVVDRHINRHNEAVIRAGAPDKLLAQLGGKLPEAPGDPDAALDLLANVALTHQQRTDHPRYFARVPGPSSFAAILGDWMGIAFNAAATSWAGGSGPATLEVVVIQWLRALLGMPAEGEGILTSGGSLANQTALVAARICGKDGPAPGRGDETPRGVVFHTEQVHASLLRSLRHLGYAKSQIREIPSDEQFRMPARDLKAAIAELNPDVRKRSIVIASAGTTNTGAIDPLDDIAELCGNDLWLHVDGAYGGAAAACPESRTLFSGIERADSMVVDPHKWLFQPFGLGCTFVRRAGDLEAAFSMYPEYLKDTLSAPGEVAFGNRGPELSRRSRAMKLWMTFKTYGAARIREAIQSGIDQARTAEEILRSKPDVWEVVTPAQIGIITFALKDPTGKLATAEVHEQRAAALAKSGFAVVTSTKLKGQSVLRLCTLNPLTTKSDLEQTIDALADRALLASS